MVQVFLYPFEMCRLSYPFISNKILLSDLFVPTFATLKGGVYI